MDFTNGLLLRVLRKATLFKEPRFTYAATADSVGLLTDIFSNKKIFLKNMNEEWLNWTKLNLDRGCDPAEIRNILANNGFSEADIDQAMRPPEKSTLWQKAFGRIAGKSVPKKTSDSRTSATEGDSVHRNSKGEIIPNDGIQPSLDYSRIAKPNLLKNEKLQQIDAEGIQLYVLDDFMSADECSAICDVMNTHLRPSTITTGDDYGGFRTSTTCDLGYQSAKIVEKIDKRIARTLGLRLPWSEVIQGQKYEVGQEFKAHTDYFEPGSKEFRTFAGDLGQRTWTFMVNLNETKKGGATYFTEIDKFFYPKLGRAIIWNNLNLDGTPNSQTMHHGMPVEQGCKMIITKWFRDKGPGDPLYARR